ncbi:hypothetical protein HC766_00860 [Candidatus Gracilibacteria bacterium]|nr:hypothetical protein [Candidatus Gracilibacteria bacterium]
MFNKKPWITLNADGESSGQEDGLVGNSEVGHMNIGALKLVKQLSLQITESSKNYYSKGLDSPDQKFDPKNYMNMNDVVHLVGLFSEGTIHSDLRHWIGAIEAAGQKKGQFFYIGLVMVGILLEIVLLKLGMILFLNTK